MLANHFIQFPGDDLVHGFVGGNASNVRFHAFCFTVFADRAVIISCTAFPARNAQKQKNAEGVSSIGMTR